MAQAQRPQRGEIWLVRFDPSVGAEIRKLRPAVVTNVDAVGRLPLRIVVPITDWQSSFGSLPWFTLIPASAQSGRIQERMRFRLSPSPNLDLCVGWAKSLLNTL